MAVPKKIKRILFHLAPAALYWAAEQILTEKEDPEAVPLQLLLTGLPISAAIFYTVA